MMMMIMMMKTPRPGDVLEPSYKISFSQWQRAPWLFGPPALRGLRGGAELRPWVHNMASMSIT